MKTSSVEARRQAIRPPSRLAAWVNKFLTCVDARRRARGRASRAALARPSRARRLRPDASPTSTSACPISTPAISASPISPSAAPPDILRAYRGSLHRSFPMTAIVWLRDDLQARRPAGPSRRRRPARARSSMSTTRRPRRGRSAARAAGGSTSRWRPSPDIARTIGGRLDILRGSAEAVIPALARATPRPCSGPAATAARRSRPTSASRPRCSARASRRRASTASCCASRGTVKTDAGAPFKVFTPFWRRCREMGPFDAAAARPEAPRRRALARASAAARRRSPTSACIRRSPIGRPASPKRGDRARPARGRGSPTSSTIGLPDYAEARDRPRRARRRRGCRRICASAKSRRAGSSPPSRRRPQRRRRARRRTSSSPSLAGANSPIRCSTSSPRSPTKNWSPRFDAFPWRDDEAALRGLAARPHRLSRRRRRHARALGDRLHAQSRADDRRLVPDQAPRRSTGARARPGSGTRSATPTRPTIPRAGNGSPGSGADAAPYFRVFNPVLQGEKFDPEGALRAPLGSRTRRPRRALIFMRRGRRRPPSSRRRAFGSAAIIPPRSSITISPGRARSRPSPNLGEAPQRSPAARNSAKNSG